MANLTIDIKQRINASGGNTLPPSREVSSVRNPSDVQYIDNPFATITEETGPVISDTDDPKANTEAETEEGRDESNDPDNAHKLHGGFAIPLEGSLDSRLSENSKSVTDDNPNTVIPKVSESLVEQSDDQWTLEFGMAS